MRVGNYVVGEQCYDSNSSLEAKWNTQQRYFCDSCRNRSM